MRKEEIKESVARGKKYGAMHKELEKYEVGRRHKMLTNVKKGVESKSKALKKMCM